MVLFNSSYIEVPNHHLVFLTNFYNIPIFEYVFCQLRPIIIGYIIPNTIDHVRDCDIHQQSATMRAFGELKHFLRRNRYDVDFSIVLPFLQKMSANSQM